MENKKEIIIPKEEPKQICEYCKIEITKYGCGCGTEKPKQETLEKAAEKESEYLADWEDKDMYKKGFIDGAKWQQQQNKNLYSYEEVYQILSKFRELRLIEFQEWFEQFKNK